MLPRWHGPSPTSQGWTGDGGGLTPQVSRHNLTLGLKLSSRLEWQVIRTTLHPCRTEGCPLAKHLAVADPGPGI